MKNIGNDIHNTLEYNFKITDMQSILGIEQLRDINERIKKKKEIFKLYKKNLKSNKNIILLILSLMKLLGILIFIQKNFKYKKNTKTK